MQITAEQAVARLGISTAPASGHGDEKAAPIFGIKTWN